MEILTNMLRIKPLNAIIEHFQIHKICALLGPRQCGKTTLADYFAAQNNIPRVNRFDLEDPLDLQRLTDPMLALSDLKGFVIIDEIQYKPDIFKVLRVLVDRTNIKFLILGSASRDLIKQSSETLVGRIGYVEMTPFDMSEVEDLKKLWIGGGFPLSYLASNASLSGLWRRNHIKTYLERDIPNLGFAIPPERLRKFWVMLCHYHGGIFNASELGKSLEISDHTAKRYLSILQGTFMIRVLQPWHENLKKRQVKAPKIYFRDSGIYHSLLGLGDLEAMMLSPKIGSSWEGFALEQIIHHCDAEEEDCYFWASHNGAEIDLIIFKNGKRLGFEFKYTDRPKITPSMRISMEDLKLDQIQIIFPGNIRFKLSENIEAVGLESLK
jgi:predicted AAA+ superfamily ATPase